MAASSASSSSAQCRLRSTFITVLVLSLPYLSQLFIDLRLFLAADPALTASATIPTNRSNNVVTLSTANSTAFGSNGKTTNGVDCLKSRGVYGKWEKDLDYAKQVQYIPHNGFRQRQFKRKHRGDGEYLPQTTYAWKETKYPQCQPQVMTKNGFCDVLQRLKIRNIFLIGDSMMGQMYESLQGLLELDKGELFLNCPQHNSSNNSTWNVSIMFDRSILYSIPLPANYTQNDERIDQWGYDRITVIPNYGQVGISQCPALSAKDRPGIGSVKGPKLTANGACVWVEDYKKAKGRSLLVMNTGAAYHATHTFHQKFDGVLNALDRVLDDDNNHEKRQDVAFFRSVSPAHWKCFEPYKEILDSFEEYMDRYETTTYAWNLFRRYNDYAQKRIEEREAQRMKEGPSSSLYPLRFLNIHNITALRPDGHKAANDCLHYELPGVLDWWNHILYTNMLDISNREAPPETSGIVV